MGWISVANPAEKQSSTVIPANTAGGLLLQVVRYAIAIGALIGAGITGVWWWVARDISTENAYVVGNVTPISAEVTGNVVALFADDNMLVKAGEPLLQIDPVPYQLSVEEARADYRKALKELEAAAITVRLTDQDRKSGFDSAQARMREQEEGLKASELEASARESIHNKEKETLLASRAEEPGLIALERNARDYFERYDSLAKSGDIPIQDRDNKEATWKDALARLNNLKSRIAALESQVMASDLDRRQALVRVEKQKRAVSDSQAMVGRAQAGLLQPDIAEADRSALQRRVDLSRAKLQQARLRLANTLVRAPMAGIVSKRTAQLGQTLTSGQPFLSITPLDLDNVWVVANLREDQLARTKVGQQVMVTVDAIPGMEFPCWVESLSGGTGAAFSLFPPDNATGNFTRIVQRLPVRLRFQAKENYQDRIRPGMSCKIKIDPDVTVREASVGQ
jgi:membrane fusion protein (multidrug efflux system)